MNDTKLIEVQVDRLVGPTHHFGGLGVGNLASSANAGTVSNPAAAAMQGLDKMRQIAGLGIPQFVLPPQRRPDFDFLRSLGFSGSDWQILADAMDCSPDLLSAAASCSAMWMANAATVTPSVDNSHGQLTLTVANLTSSLHRSLEPAQTTIELRELFSGIATVNEGLPGGSAMRDEGAANHMRLGSTNNEPGIQLLVYGDAAPTRIHWPRQTLAACQAIARLHGWHHEHVFFLPQSSEAIDAGAFHNDVVAMSHHHLWIHHQRAYSCDKYLYGQVQAAFDSRHKQSLIRIEVTEQELSLADAVRTYLFNSQIVSPPEPFAKPIIVCPLEVREHAGAFDLVRRWCNEMHLFSDVHFVDLRQSMNGGGGPACLRLRVPLTNHQMSRLPERYRWSEALDDKLRQIIDQHYPTQLTLGDFAATKFVDQISQAQQQIENCLG